MPKKKSQKPSRLKNFKSPANSSLSSINSNELEVPQTSSTLNHNGRTSHRSLNAEYDSHKELKESSKEEDNYSADPDYIMSSQTSSQSNEFAIITGNHTLLYLDLREPIARVTMEPLMDPLIDRNEELIIKLKKLLGLLSPRRCLYCPSKEFGRYELKVKEPLMTGTSGIFAPVNQAQLTNRTSSTSNLFKNNAISCIDRKWKMFHDYLIRINAICFTQTKMAIHIGAQEAIDLTELPSQAQRNQLCRQHTSCLACLEEHPLFYSFIESLNSDIPLNMCHPMAMSYRLRDFQQSKQQLARQLFNIFNHRIFYCGLNPKINWKTLKFSKSRLIVNGKEASRSAAIILDEKIKDPAVLVKILLHEMCHVAAFVYNSEIGHGDNCRKWTYLAKFLMPELPFADDCDPTYKYSCYLCGGTSFGHPVELIDGIRHLHCSYCQFEVVAEPWQCDNPHFWSPKDSLMTPYKVFIKENYLKTQSKIIISDHNERMRQLNLQYIQQVSIK